MILLKKSDLCSLCTLFLFVFSHLVTAGPRPRIKLEKVVKRSLETCGQGAECVSESEYCNGVINLDEVKKQKCSLDHKLSNGFCCPVKKVVRTTRQTKMTYEEQKSDLDVVLDESGPIKLTPEEPECGRSIQSKSKISSSENSTDNSWPWMAVLLHIDTYLNFCGGVLINKRFVLTAAHCFKVIPFDKVVVRLGEYDFSKITETTYKDFKVIDFRLHPDYDAATHANDIAILKLHKIVDYSMFIQPICLPKTDMNIYNNQSAVVTGWGRTSFGGAISDVLLEVSVPVWEHADCVAAFSQPIFKTNICAASPSGGKDSCLGDSGGPLMMQRPDGRWTNIGVVSWGIGCAEPNLPGVYTKVVSFLKWIATKVQDVM